ncbi:unnamed protein product [Polarella glacialis]|uniref:Uncharacterized protein n=1 Tax=Polarella glacialis TaxID=89957 RepID=A0A813KBE8_POLGL|nr:unnamed protein product [Polarella glacialis]CAE8611679.1 unnamed protein product [Polarella glacialis]CAE8702223.1 unnamed protein product [Polarella glacialis]
MQDYATTFGRVFGGGGAFACEGSRSPCTSPRTWEDVRCLPGASPRLSRIGQSSPCGEGLGGCRSLPAFPPFAPPARSACGNQAASPRASADVQPLRVNPRNAVTTTTHQDLSRPKLAKPADFHRLLGGFREGLASESELWQDKEHAVHLGQRKLSDRNRSQLTVSDNCIVGKPRRKAPQDSLEASPKVRRDQQSSCGFAFNRQPEPPRETPREPQPVRPPRHTAPAARESKVELATQVSQRCEPVGSPEKSSAGPVIVPGGSTASCTSLLDSGTTWDVLDLRPTLQSRRRRSLNEEPGRFWSDQRYRTREAAAMRTHALKGQRWNF